MSKILKKLALKTPANGQFKNPNQGMLSTLVHTYGLILDPISQCRVSSKLSQMCQKTELLCSIPHRTPQVCHTPPQKWYHHIA